MKSKKTKKRSTVEKSRGKAEQTMVKNTTPAYDLEINQGIEKIREQLISQKTASAPQPAMENDIKAEKSPSVSSEVKDQSTIGYKHPYELEVKESRHIGRKIAIALLIILIIALGVVLGLVALERTPPMLLPLEQALTVSSQSVSPWSPPETPSVSVSPAATDEIMSVPSPTPTESQVLDSTALEPEESAEEVSNQPPVVSPPVKKPSVLDQPIVVTAPATKKYSPTRTGDLVEIENSRELGSRILGIVTSIDRYDISSKKRLGKIRQHKSYTVYVFETTVPVQLGDYVSFTSKDQIHAIDLLNLGRSINVERVSNYFAPAAQVQTPTLPPAPMGGEQRMGIIKESRLSRDKKTTGIVRDLSSFSNYEFIDNSVNKYYVGDHVYFEILDKFGNAHVLELIPDKVGGRYSPGDMGYHSIQ